MPVAETTNTFLVEEVKKKLKSYKSCQNTKVYKCPLQNSYWNMAQWVRLYSTQLPFPKCCLCKGLTLQSFCYF